MDDPSTKTPEPFVRISEAERRIEKFEEVIKSEWYELRNGKVWFSQEIEREHRRLKTSLGLLVNFGGDSLEWKRLVL